MKYVVTDDSDEEEIEEVVKKQFNSRQNRYEFLVKWKGYTSKQGHVWLLQCIILIINQLTSPARLSLYHRSNFSPRLSMSGNNSINSRWTLDLVYSSTLSFENIHIFLTVGPASLSFKGAGTHFLLILLVFVKLHLVLCLVYAR